MSPKQEPKPIMNAITEEIIIFVAVFLLSSDFATISIIKPTIKTTTLIKSINEMIKNKLSIKLKY
ncbi:hypothetical protein [Flavobacterium terrae]|uniref:hypothetical protein n=1 Tax=Flavobacterium terrae TaxID=415425 RepID=UPI001160AA6B|nr:hypothetical protein [Flavobacterium terrae]